MRRVLLALLGSVVAAQAAFAASPSLDCPKAKAGSVEAVVCGSAELSALHGEADRVIAVLLPPPHTPGRVALPNKCAPLTEPCVRRYYLERINFIRSGMLAAHRRDPGGLSRGPIVYLCDGVEGALNVTFVDTETRRAYATFRDAVFFFQESGHGSAAEYRGEKPGELLRPTSDTARFRAGSDSPEVSCKVYPTGR